MKQLSSGCTGLWSVREEKQIRWALWSPGGNFQTVGKTDENQTEPGSICELRRRSEFGEAETPGSWDAGFWSKMSYAEKVLHKSM